MSQHQYGLARLLDDASNRPPHRPRRPRPHVADEYEGLAAHSGQATAVHMNRTIA